MLLAEATQQFLMQCELRGLRPATIESYSWQLRPFVAFLDVVQQVGDVQRVDVEMYLLSLRRRGLADRSVCDALTVLRLFWNWAAAEHLCAVAPVADIKLRRRGSGAGRDSSALRRADWREYDALVNALPITTWVDRRDILLIH